MAVRASLRTKFLTWITLSTVSLYCVCVNVKDEPRFTIRPITQIAAVGANIILDCMVNGTPPITLEWQKDGQALSSDDRVVIEKYPSGVVSVLIERVELTDSGRYSCYTFNSFGTAEYEVEVFVTSKVGTCLGVLQREGHAYNIIIVPSWGVGVAVTFVVSQRSSVARTYVHTYV